MLPFIMVICGENDFWVQGCYCCSASLCHLGNLSADVFQLCQWFTCTLVTFVMSACVYKTEIFPFVINAFSVCTWSKIARCVYLNFSFFPFFFFLTRVKMWSVLTQSLWFWTMVNSVKTMPFLFFLFF